MNVGILPSVNFTEQKRVAKSGMSVCCRIIRLMNNQTKSLRKATIPTKGRESDDKNAVAFVKIVPHLGCVSQDSEALVSQRKRAPGNPMRKVLGPIRKVRFTQCTPRQPGKERTVAWTSTIFELKEKDKATFYSPAEEWVLPAASTKDPEERKFVVDSGACMHTVSKRDLNSAELETMRISRSPTTVMTANGEVQTREEATVYVKKLDSFVKVMLLEESPAVLSKGKVCEDHGHTYHWTSHQKQHLTTNGKRTDCNFSNNVPFVVPG